VTDHADRLWASPAHEGAEITFPAEVEDRRFAASAAFTQLGPVWREVLEVAGRNGVSGEPGRTSLAGQAPWRQ
jgi:hypothetical protein